MAQKPEPPQEHKFIYYQPKWKGRKVVRHFVSALAIGSLTLSMSYVYKKNDQGWSRETVISRKDTKGPRDQFFPATVVFVTSGSTWSIPADCSAVTQVDCIGAGGSGGARASGGCATGAGGGAFSRNTTTINVIPGGSLNIGVGNGGAAVSQAGAGGVSGNPGGDTWWNATSLANAVSNGTSLSCGAQGGSPGITASGSGSLAQGGLGGAAGSGVGTSKTSGGQGGSNTALGNQGYGGGGAGGPNGDGVAGTSGGTNVTPTAGGAGDASAGGGGSAGVTNGNSGAGGTGNEYGGSQGSGGGSGGIVTNVAASTGLGGQYGGGSGGAQATLTTFTVSSGKGGNGLIVVTYTPLIAGLSGRFSTFDPPASPKNWPLNAQNRNAQQRDFVDFIGAPGNPTQFFGNTFPWWPNAPAPNNFARARNFQDFINAPGNPNQFFGSGHDWWPRAPAPVNFARDWIAFSGNLRVEFPIYTQPFLPFDPGRIARNTAIDWITQFGNIGVDTLPADPIDFTTFALGSAAKLWTRYGQQPQWWTYEFKAPVRSKLDKHDGDWIPKRHHWPRRHPSVYTQEYYDALRKKVERTEEEEQLLEEIAQVVPNLLIPINRLIPPLILPSLTQLPPFRPVPTLTMNPPPFRMATPEEMAADDAMIIRMLLEE